MRLLMQSTAHLDVKAFQFQGNLKALPRVLIVQSLVHAISFLQRSLGLCQPPLGKFIVSDNRASMNPEVRRPLNRLGLHDPLDI